MLPSKQSLLGRVDSFAQEITWMPMKRPLKPGLPPDPHSAPRYCVRASALILRVIVTCDPDLLLPSKPVTPWTSSTAFEPFAKWWSTCRLVLHFIRPRVAVADEDLFVLRKTGIATFTPGCSEYP
jgi:hypothetical protein